MADDDRLLTDFIYVVNGDRLLTMVAIDMLFDALDGRFPHCDIHDCAGDALAAAVDLLVEHNESATSYIGRARTVFNKATTEGVYLPSVARGVLLLKGTRLGGERRAVVLATTPVCIC